MQEEIAAERCASMLGRIERVLVEEKAKQEAALAEPKNKIAEKVKAKRLLEESENAEDDEEEYEEEESEERTGKEVPFGPHLAFGIAVVLFIGQRILTWYFDMVVDGLMQQ